MFQALAGQNAPSPYMHLLAKLSDDQKGLLGKTDEFPIQRGVRPGDVLSSLLVHATVEQVMRRWKEKLNTHGLKICSDIGVERLTHVRFADDLITYANSQGELVEMIELLVHELLLAGLELNIENSRLFTLNEEDVQSIIPVLVEVADGFVEAARRGHALSNGIFCALSQFG